MGVIEVVVVVKLAVLVVMMIFGVDLCGNATAIEKSQQKGEELHDHLWLDDAGVFGDRVDIYSGGEEIFSFGFLLSYIYFTEHKTGVSGLSKHKHDSLTVKSTDFILKISNCDISSQSEWTLFWEYHINSKKCPLSPLWYLFTEDWPYSENIMYPV